MQFSKWVIIFRCLLLVTFALEAKPTVCLNMIVKDEAKVIERALASAKPFIDYWVIVDTGSTDGTQTIIKNFLKGVPGELHERPWVNFEHNRNEALTLAKDKSDYILFIDADEQLMHIDKIDKAKLDKDGYYFIVHLETAEFQRLLLVKNSFNWKWVGVLHEDLVCQEADNRALLPDVCLLANTNDGARSRDPNKYLKDAEILERALEKEPTNARYAFYLAQSYLCAHDYPKALEAYKKRAAMPGWDQEIYFSLYKVGQLQEVLQFPYDTVVNSYCKAYQFRPTRAEPLFFLANYMKTKGAPLIAYLVAKHALSIPKSNDNVYVEGVIYDVGLLELLGRSAFDLGRYEEARRLFKAVLAKPDIPEYLHRQVLCNLIRAEEACKSK